jgi:hypothetical protein
MFRSFLACVRITALLLRCECQEQAAVVSRSFNCCVYWYEREFLTDTQKKSKRKSVADMHDVSLQDTTIVARHNFVTCASTGFRLGSLCARDVI